ncbi:MAG: hypothetical protein M1827_000537 [Pycnora praestabilis]|nr:MAG: hypothetical protein M1827_000537 [Pycnora praestabilis]
MADIGDDEPWTESEKLTLLLEILKISEVPSSALFRLLDEHKVNPDWTLIPPSPRRSVESRISMFKEGLIANPPSATSGSFQESRNSNSNATRNPKKRLYSTSETSTPTARVLQPKLPSSGLSNTASANGETGSPYQTSLGDASGEPAKKKRGRPSKAESEARSAAALAKGEIWRPPKTQKPAKGARQSGEGLGEDNNDSTPTAVMTTPIAHLVEALKPSTSSGSKPKRGRPSKADLEAKKLVLEATAVAATEMGKEDIGVEPLEEATADEQKEAEVIQKLLAQNDEAPAAISEDVEAKDVAMNEASGPEE